jgi:hypothetical protein
MDKGKWVTKQILRKHFEKTRKEAAAKADEEKRPALAAAIRQMWFYDLRATAADDTSDERGEQATINLLAMKTFERQDGIIFGEEKSLRQPSNYYRKVLNLIAIFWNTFPSLRNNFLGR